MRVLRRDRRRGTNPGPCSVKTTRYFQEQVLRKRPYIEPDWCLAVLANPLRCEHQEDGRIRHWGYIAVMSRYLRVVTLSDGETIHNAFFDRNFRPEA
jgi:hypothetical protein